MSTRRRIRNAYSNCVYTSQEPEASQCLSRREQCPRFCGIFTLWNATSNKSEINQLIQPTAESVSKHYAEWKKQAHPEDCTLWDSDVCGVPRVDTTNQWWESRKRTAAAPSGAGKGVTGNWKESVSYLHRQKRHRHMCFYLYLYLYHSCIYLSKYASAYLTVVHPLNTSLPLKVMQEISSVGDILAEMFRSEGN